MLKTILLATFAAAGLGLSSGGTFAGVVADGIIVYDCPAAGPGTGSEICAINTDGTGFRALTDSSAGNTGPEVSPNGKYIAWRFDIAELWIMDLDGGNPRNVADPEVVTSFGEPTWSPNSQQLAAYCNNPDNVTEKGFCIVDVETGAVQYGYTIEFYLVEDLAWSPDGTRILFSGEQISGGADLHVLDLETGVAQNITQTVGDSEYGTWSPDGQSIAFVGHPTDADADDDPFPNLYRIDPDGDNRELLYDPASLSTSHSNPGYSPDGKHIVWSCSDSGPGTRDICVNDAESGAREALFVEGGQGRVHMVNPDWGSVGGDIFGDFDCDGDVDGDDMLVLLTTINGGDAAPCVSLDGNEVNGQAQPAADLNCDGNVNALDGLPILYLLIGTPSITGGCAVVGTAARIFLV